VRVFYLVVLTAWLLGADLVLVATVNGGLAKPFGLLGGWAFVVAGGGLLVAVVWRDQRNRRGMATLLDQHREALALIAALAEPSVAALPLDRLLDVLLAHLQVVLSADAACILMPGPDMPELAVRASRGFDQAADQGPRLHIDLRLAELVAAGQVAVVARGPGGATTPTLPPSPRLGHLAGCPILLGDQLIGVCLVDSRITRRFSDRDLQLLQVIANRAGVAIEQARQEDAERRSRLAAEHARLHLSLLARASETLSRALDDYEPSLAALVDVVVPEFGDWCTIDAVDASGVLRRLAIRHGDHHGADGEAEVVVQSAEWTRLAEQVLADGRSHLVWSGPPDPGTGPLDGNRQHAASFLATPIRTRGLTFGVITCATDAARRGYRPSDLAFAEQLAGRAAVVVERVLLYREVNNAAHASERTASQLRRLIDASLELQRPRTGIAVLPVVADYAQRVFGGDVAVVTAEPVDRGLFRAVARKGTVTVCAPIEDAAAVIDLPPIPHPPADSVHDGRWLSAALPSRQGVGPVSVAVARPDGSEASADDHAVLVLLVQMTSAALDSARLSRVVESRQARWRVLIEATPAGIVEVDLAGHILLWNRFAATMFGWPDHDDPSRPAPSFPGDAVASLTDLWARAAASLTTTNAELSTVLAGGESRDLALSAAPLLSADGRVQAMLTLAVDVTEHKRLEARMREAQRIEAIGQVGGGVAHDFNNLLTVIAGYTDLLLWRGDLDDSSRQMLDAISEAASRATVLTGQLLTFSRRQTPNPVVFSPSVALLALAHVLDRILGIEITLRWNLDDSSGNARIDAARFEQVILNLAINARDAMPTGGFLDVATAPASLDSEHAAQLKVRPGRYIRMTVSDNGIGMDVETSRSCFNPFFTTKDRSRGTGLGLAAVQGIVTENGGGITVTSAPGRGTSFDVYLPRTDEAVILTAVDAPVATPGGSETVLVVEDQADVRALIRRVLERDGYLVLEAAGGAEALEVADAWEAPIDLVLSDVIMPGMRGPAVVEALKRKRPSMAVLFMSAYTDGTSVADAMEGEPSRLLAKPFRPSELAARVREVLHDHQRAARTGSRHPAPS
jgi:PAS domain S-box-containing protein